MKLTNYNTVNRASKTATDTAACRSRAMRSRLARAARKVRRARQKENHPKA